MAAERINPNDLRGIGGALEVYLPSGQTISSMQQEGCDDVVRRPDWSWGLLGGRRARDDCNRRINARVRRMVSAGLVDEARRVYDHPRGVGAQARQAVGYAELFEHFAGRLSLDEAVERIKIHSRRLAKQQRTWLRRLGGLRWYDVAAHETSAALWRRVRPAVVRPPCLRTARK